MRKLLFFITLAVLIIMFIPWLGETLFNTKGEPREAIVAVSMIQSGNYILPESCGTDIPYKPPFLAWLIVAASWLTGGVTEFSSRLPSAIATILLAMGGYCFFRRHTRDYNDIVAIVTTIVTVTAFEVFRNATVCRVDMVLTACMVGALYMMYNRWSVLNRPGVSVWAILLMSCAVLTKGPVGMALPCLVMWVFYLLRGENFLKSTWTLAVMGILSLVLPAIWYWAAAQQGGERFIALAIEENFGRMTGTMSYESHENPFYYNFITIIAGMAPYTLLALFSIFAIRKRRERSLGERKTGVRNMEPITLFSIVSVAVIVIFYCIPKSKRSVYLLPVYPFLAYFVTLLILWLVRRRSLALNFYSFIIGLLALTVPAILIGVHCMDITHLLAGQKPDTVVFVNGLREAPLTWISWIFIILSFVAGIMIFIIMARGGKGTLIASAFAATVIMYLNFSATAFPAILNTKSDYTLACVINRLQPEGNVYGFISSHHLLRYYTAGFYTGDRIKPFNDEVSIPVDGIYMLAGEKDINDFNEKYGSLLSIQPVYTSTRKSCDTRQITTIYKVTKNRSDN